MRIITLALVLSLFISNISQAIEFNRDLDYRYNPKKDECSSKKSPGFNKELLGECGMILGNGSFFEAQYAKEKGISTYDPAQIQNMNELLKSDEVSYKQFISGKFNVSNSNLKGLNMKLVELPSSNFEKSNFTGAWLSLLNLRGANLKNTKFNKAKLGGIDLRDADLGGADLSTAEIYWGYAANGKNIPMNFEGAHFNKNTKLPFSREKALELKMVFEGEGPFKEEAKSPATHTK